MERRDLTNWDFDKLDAVIEPILAGGRVPGAALAMVAAGRAVFAQGYGYRDLAARLPMTARTVYPIASTSKGINALLLAMLVEEGRLAWDERVQHYLPHFRLRDPVIGTQVTVRDLVVMRTGLPRHDWFYTANPLTRAQLVERLQYLELSAGLRERFQYNNLTVTIAGHIAEVVCGRTWDELVRNKILEPLGMASTGFVLPDGGEVTLSYHEDAERKLRPARRLATQVTAPSGGAIHSTIEDMARWVRFNLSGGCVDGHALVQPQTLRELHLPQIVVRNDASARKPNATYALGWSVDAYNGHARVSHGGYLYDVNSEVVLFPQHDLGIVVFTNFGPPMLSLLIAEHAFDAIMRLQPVHSLAECLTAYEGKIAAERTRRQDVRRIPNTSASHDLDSYMGIYEHPGYGALSIHRQADELIFERNELALRLQHWHYDVWGFTANDLFGIHESHAFDEAHCLWFDSDAAGTVAGVSLQFEPTVNPIRFAKRWASAT